MRSAPQMTAQARRWWAGLDPQVQTAVAALADRRQIARPEAYDLLRDACDVVADAGMVIDPNLDL